MERAFTRLTDSLKDSLKPLLEFFYISEFTPFTELVQPSTTNSLVTVTSKLLSLKPGYFKQG